MNKKNLRSKIILTNYTIILAVLFASFAGLLIQFDTALPMEWSGVVGHFIAYVLVKSAGVTGAIICVIGGFIIVLTLLIDLDYRVSWAKICETVVVWL